MTIATTENATQTDAEITTADALAVFESITANSATAARNRALLVSLWRVGLRPGEALDLRADQVDLDGHCLRIGTRLVGLDAMSTEVFGEWMGFRDKLELPAEGPFISTLKGGALAQAYVRELLPRLADSAGVTVRLHGMGLRYLCVREMVEEGVSLEVIQEQVDSWPQSSVSRFLPRPSDDELLAAIAARPRP